MAKKLNDVLKGVKSSTTEPLTTGNIPGVDYANKMQDTRDFVAKHSVEKHQDRVGNDDEVYKASKVKKAEMKRHGHEPKPKDVQVYNKTNQATNEEVELDETSGAKADRYKKAVYSGMIGLAVHTKDSPAKTRKLLNRKAGLERADKAIDKDIAKKLAAQKKKLGEAKMCETCGKSPCGCDDKETEPRYNGKDKTGKRKLLTDKKLQEKLTKDMSAGDIIKDFEKSKDPRFDGDSKEKRKQRALGAYYKLHPEKSKKKVDEAVYNHSPGKTASEEAREKIHGAIVRKKEKIEKEKMKEQAAPTETNIKMPSGMIGDTGRV